MQFLQIIEGKTGEDLTSAVLKFLLVNSSLMRERFVQRLRAQLPASKTPTFRDGIICRNEYSTEKDGYTGRLDLLIREESGMVLGLENKFWADFTDDQPAKYLPTLESLTQNDPSARRVILLFPQAREDEIRKHVEMQNIRNDCVFLTWEQVSDDLKSVVTTERAEIAAAAIYLREYIATQALETEIDISPIQLVGHNVTIGNDFHYEFLYKMKSCFPNAASIRPAKAWIGFHFDVLAEDGMVEKSPTKQWFGFLKMREDTPVIMGIHTEITKYHPQSLLDGFECCTDGFGEYTLIRIDYDNSLKSVPAWKARLDPVLRDLKQAVRERVGEMLTDAPGRALLGSDEPASTKETSS